MTVKNNRTEEIFSKQIEIKSDGRLKEIKVGKGEKSQLLQVVIRSDDPDQISCYVRPVRFYSKGVWVDEISFDLKGIREDKEIKATGREFNATGRYVSWICTFKKNTD